MSRNKPKLGKKPAKGRRLSSQSKYIVENVRAYSSEDHNVVNSLTHLCLQYYRSLLQYLHQLNFPHQTSEPLAHKKAKSRPFNLLIFDKYKENKAI